MVFTLLVPRTTAQGPTWARVVSIIANAGGVPVHETGDSPAGHGVGVHHAAH